MFFPFLRCILKTKSIHVDVSACRLAIRAYNNFTGARTAAPGRPFSDVLLLRVSLVSFRSLPSSPLSLLRALWAAGSFDSRRRVDEQGDTTTPSFPPSVAFPLLFYSLASEKGEGPASHLLLFRVVFLFF